MEEVTDHINLLSENQMTLYVSWFLGSGPGFWWVARRRYPAVGGCLAAVWDLRLKLKVRVTLVKLID